MKVAATFVGTVSAEPKFIDGQQGRKGFVGVTIESPDSFSKYPNRVKAVFYFNTDQVLNTLKKGDMVCVVGEATAEGWINRNEKVSAIIRISVKSWEVLGGSTEAPAARPAPTARPTRPARPTTPHAAPEGASDLPPEDPDDCPF